MVHANDILRKSVWGLVSKDSVVFEKIASLIALSAVGSTLTPEGVLAAWRGIVDLRQLSVKKETTCQKI